MILPPVTKGDNLQTNPQLPFGIQSHQSTWLHSATSHHNHANYSTKGGKYATPKLRYVHIYFLCRDFYKQVHLILVQGLLYTDTFYTPNLHTL